MISNDSNVKKKAFSSLDVIKSVLTGAPFIWRNEAVPWHLVTVPRFPVAFSLLSGIFWAVLSKVKAIQVQESVALKEVIFGLITGSVISGGFFIVLNVVIMGGFWLVLETFKNRYAEKDSGTLIAGAQRVLYFSTFFQTVFFLFMGVSYLAGTYVGASDWLEYPLLLGFLGFGTLRLMAVFQSMRNETRGSVFAGLFAMFFCFDLWGTFVPIVFGYIW